MILNSVKWSLGLGKLKTCLIFVLIYVLIFLRFSFYEVWEYVEYYEIFVYWESLGILRIFGPVAKIGPEATVVMNRVNGSAVPRMGSEPNTGAKTFAAVYSVGSL